MLRMLVDGEGADPLARRNLAEVLLLLCLASRPRNRARAQKRRGQKGRGCERAANLLHDDTGLDITEARAAEFLGNENAGKSHFGKLLPQHTRETRFVALVAKLAQMRHRCVLREEAARAVAQETLFVVQDKRHTKSLRRPANRVCAWRRC